MNNKGNLKLLGYLVNAESIREDLLALFSTSQDNDNLCMKEYFSDFISEQDYNNQVAEKIDSLLDSGLSVKKVVNTMLEGCKSQGTIEDYKVDCIDISGAFNIDSGQHLSVALVLSSDSIKGQDDDRINRKYFNTLALKNGYDVKSHNHNNEKSLFRDITIAQDDYKKDNQAIIVSYLDSKISNIQVYNDINYKLLAEFKDLNKLEKLLNGKIKIERGF